MRYSFYIPTKYGKMKLYANAENIPQANMIHNELKNSKKSYRVITTYPDGVQCVSEYIN